MLRAQRRPESELRRHARYSPSACQRPTAQRRPESELRRHPDRSPDRAWGCRGSLNEGRSLNSGDTRPTPRHRHRPASLNEGRSLNSGDTPNLDCRGPSSEIASSPSVQITALAVERPNCGAISQEVEVTPRPIHAGFHQRGPRIGESPKVRKLHHRTHGLPRA